MKPHSIGRALGIGLRVAGRIAGQRVAANAQTARSAASPPARPAGANAAQSRAVGQATGKATSGVARGLAGFLRPFRRIGGILWLEVTGVFFFLFVVVFARFAWISRPSRLYGPYERNFLIAAAIVLLFLYLGVTSFWRARRR
ncbi:MAG TPA: hypothetical protein VGE83_06110 [Terracidiphilus sp.]|jgi:hypothetical protein